MNPLMEPIIVAIASRPGEYLDLLYYKGGNRFDLTPAVTSVMEMRSSEVLKLYSPLHAAKLDAEPSIVSWRLAQISTVCSSATSIPILTIEPSSANNSTACAGGYSVPRSWNSIRGRGSRPKILHKTISRSQDCLYGQWHCPRFPQIMEPVSESLTVAIRNTYPWCSWPAGFQTYWIRLALCVRSKDTLLWSGWCSI